MITHMYTLNEDYNLPPYILAASSDNKRKASTNFSFIQRMNSCQSLWVILFKKDPYYLNSRSPNKGTLLDSKSHISLVRD